MYPTTNEKQSSFQSPIPSPQPPKKRVPWRWIVSGVEIVLLVGVIISVFLFKTMTTSTTTGQSSPSAHTTPIPTATSKLAYSGQSALQILAGLQAKGLPIGTSFHYSASNDLNRLLGRPSQYTGKVNFKDTRIGTSTNQGAEISVSDGGSIEVFSSAGYALNRFTSLQALSKSGRAIFAEYEYLDGTVVLRISSQITPTQASAYQVALKALT